MKLFTQQTKMADAIHSNYLLIPVINRFGIRLGFGDKTIGTLCTELSLDTDFVLAILNAYSNDAYFPAGRLRSVRVLLLLEYLRKTHDYYRITQIPVIEQLLTTVVRRGSKKAPRLEAVMRFFREYREELLAHLDHEEQNTFPYVEALAKAVATPGAHHRVLRPKRIPLPDYEVEHEELDEKLYDLKNIIIKYVDTGVDTAATNALVFELFRLEKDVTDHVRIENGILLPLVRSMESRLRGARR